MHFDLEEGVILSWDFYLEEGVYIIWSRGVTHFCWRIKEGSSSSEVGGDTLVGP